MAATNLVAKVLQKRRKHHAGRLIKTSRMVNALTSEEKADFGECGHSCASSEPYFYDIAYRPVKRDYSIQVDENGKCVVADEIVSTKVQTKPLKPPVTTEASRVGSHGDQSVPPQPSITWKCKSECKQLKPLEVESIVELKQAFEKPMKELRHALDTCNEGCPNGHSVRGELIVLSLISVWDTPCCVPMMAGALASFGCLGQHRSMHNGHFPKLRNFLRFVYAAIRSHVHPHSLTSQLQRK